MCCLVTKHKISRRNISYIDLHNNRKCLFCVILYHIIIFPSHQKSSNEKMLLKTKLSNYSYKTKQFYLQQHSFPIQNNLRYLLSFSCFFDCSVVYLKSLKRHMNMVLKCNLNRSLEFWYLSFVCFMLSTNKKSNNSKVPKTLEWRKQS